MSRKTIVSRSALTPENRRFFFSRIGSHGMGEQAAVMASISLEARQHYHTGKWAGLQVGNLMRRNVLTTIPETSKILRNFTITSPEAEAHLQFWKESDPDRFEAESGAFIKYKHQVEEVGWLQNVPLMNWNFQEKTPKDLKMQRYFIITNSNLENHGKSRHDTLEVDADKIRDTPLMSRSSTAVKPYRRCTAQLPAK